MFPRWLVMVLFAWVEAAKAAECLVACGLQNVDPFDSEGLITWNERGACDGSTTGCTVNIPEDYLGYFSCFPEYNTFYYQWRVCTSADSVGTDGSSACTCNVCVTTVESGTTQYMETSSIWTRAMCYIAAMEDAGYDMSLCVAAVVDSKTLLCVDEPFETPDVDQFFCKVPDFELTAPTDPACVPDGGEVRKAAEMFLLSPTPAQEVATPAPEAVQEVATPAPKAVQEVAQTSAPDDIGSNPGSDEQLTPAPSGTSSGQSPVGSPTEDTVLETGSPLVSDRVVASDGEGSSGTSAEIAIGIASLVVAFLGVVAGGLWGTASTVYFNFKCCISSGSGPVVTVGARAPKEKWLPFRMASDARVVPPKPTFATAVESEAIVSSVTAGIEHMLWTPIPAATGMSLHLTVDGRSYVFKSCATSTTEGGRRIIVGGIKRASAVEAEVLARVVDIVTVNESCALATEYPSGGRFRILRTCASHTSSLATYAVVETIGERPYVLIVR